MSPKIRFADPPRPIQFAGYTPLSKITLRNGLVGFNREDDGSYDTPHETPYAHGAAMMVRRETIEQAGEMPELYFLYYEELDWSERIIPQRLGHRLRTPLYGIPQREPHNRPGKPAADLLPHPQPTAVRLAQPARCGTPADGTLPMRRSGAEKCGDRPAPRSGRPRPRNGTGHRRFFYDEKQNGLDAALGVTPHRPVEVDRQRHTPRKPHRAQACFYAACTVSDFENNTIF